jgi:hypothetical protein
MKDIRSPEQEAAEDVFFGQVVIIWARWAVILVGILLVAWAVNSATDIGAIEFNIVFVVALMFLNFFLHGSYTLERPQNRGVVTVVSVLDLAIVSLIVVFWQGKTGFASPFFVLYYPFVLAFSLVFPWRIAAVYTAATILVYAAVCVLTGGIDSADHAKTLLMRAITLASIGGLATYYWRLQRDRRRAAYGYAPHAKPAATQKLSPVQT